MPVNHYEALGVPMGADPAEIRRAYVRLARRHHPDLHHTEGPQAQVTARRRMLEVNAAWAVLGDPDRRRRYDHQVRSGSVGEGTPVTEAGTPVGRDGQVRPGRAWSPLADDTDWMSDFEAWRQETDRLPEDPPAPNEGRNSLAIIPVALFVAAVAAGCVALVMKARPLLAAAYVGVALSAVAFFTLPLIEMARRRRHDQ